MTVRAVVFDLGGVVFPSPIEAMRDFEREHDLPHRFLSEVVLAGPTDGAWNRLERGELTVATFVPLFEAECADRGHTVDATAMMTHIGAGLGPRPEMLTAIEILRERGLRTAALTNNWVATPDGDGPHGDGPDGDGPDRDGTTNTGPLDDVFDVVVESARVGMRKPDPRIYELVCARLGVEPDETAFLDDIGANLKPARAMGMTTIKVLDAAGALAELAEVVGFPLDTPGSRTWS